MSPYFSGSGPGERTSDGCSVELYARLPYRGELDCVRTLLRPGTSVLELGAGAGRLTRKLLAWGLNVTAVDNSAQMLAHVPDGAERVVAAIEDLRLSEAFDTVLLASNLVNHPAAATRISILTTVRRHLAHDGQLLMERHNPEQIRQSQVGSTARFDGGEIAIEAVRHDDPDVEMTARYTIGNQIWRHSFRMTLLSEAEIEALLSAVGFRSYAWLGERRTWVHALSA